MDPEDVARVAGIELDVYSDLQAAIHHIPSRDPGRQGRDEKRIVEDIFMPPSEVPLISWTSTPQLSILGGTAEKRAVKFSVNPYFSRVYSFFVCMSLPKVSVAEEYREVCRIAWSPNIAGNLLGRGRVTYGITIAEDFSVYADDIERQFNCGKPGHQEGRMRDAGLMPALTGWTTILRPFGPLYATPTFHFTRDAIHCLRPNLLHSKSQVAVTFTPRQYSQVLRMQVLRAAENGTECWTSVPFDQRLAQIEDITRTEGLESQSTPYTAKIECIMVNPEQKESDVNCNESYVNHIKTYKIQEKPHVGFGEVAELEVTHTSICVAMFLLAFNERSVACGCHSNYTTNPDSPENGVDPLEGCEIFYDQTFAKTYDAYHMSSIEARKCPSMPYEVGYHVVVLCPCDPFTTSPHSLRGIVPGRHKMRLAVKLKQFSDEMVGARREDKFTVVLAMLMVKKLAYVKVDDGEPSFSVTVTE